MDMFFNRQSSFVTFHEIFDKSNIKSATSVAETAYPSGASKFTSGFLSVGVAQCLVFSSPGHRPCELL